jgi:hypothetical protein
LSDPPGVPGAGKDFKDLFKWFPDIAGSIEGYKLTNFTPTNAESKSQPLNPKP